MRKPVIGILPTSNYNLTNDTFADTYRFGNNYIKKIVELGGIPYLIPLCDDKMILDSLELCDGLILPGGNRILKANLDIVNYFYEKKKPMLGICLGMQTLGAFSANLEDGRRVIKKIDNGVSHWPINVLRDNNTEVVHKCFIEENTKLYDIFKSNIIEVNSVHNSTISDVGSIFKVSIKSEDGLIEGIEYIDDDRFIVGVQFHPEILSQFNSLFEKFIIECKKNL